MFQSLAQHDTLPVAPTRHVDELPLFHEWHPHMLLTGEAATVSHALARVRPHLRGPVSQWRPAIATDPPQVTTGALMIWGVDRLTLDQQRRLLAWMTAAGANVQILSIAERPLFPLVCQKAFLDDLYYRLNMVCVAADDRHVDSRTTLF